MDDLGKSALILGNPPNIFVSIPPLYFFVVPPHVAQVRRPFDDATCTKKRGNQLIGIIKSWFHEH